mmetsp:Transcript_34358/g.72304  ORF Transcript_34358/g.72304 Transcript_34358/m.72304 type:complete len:285 (-) Transcript_34358:2195-3049(-)
MFQRLLGLGQVEFGSSRGCIAVGKGHRCQISIVVVVIASFLLHGRNVAGYPLLLPASAREVVRGGEESKARRIGRRRLLDRERRVDTGTVAIGREGTGFDRHADRGRVRIEERQGRRRRWDEGFVLQIQSAGNGIGPMGIRQGKTRRRRVIQHGGEGINARDRIRIGEGRGTGSQTAGIEQYHMGIRHRRHTRSNPSGTRQIYRRRARRRPRSILRTAIQAPGARQYRLGVGDVAFETRRRRRHRRDFDGGREGGGRWHRSRPEVGGEGSGREGGFVQASGNFE